MEEQRNSSDKRGVGHGIGGRQELRDRHLYKRMICMVYIQKIVPCLTSGDCKLRKMEGYETNFEGCEPFQCRELFKRSERGARGRRGAGDEDAGSKPRELKHVGRDVRVDRGRKRRDVQ